MELIIQRVSVKIKKQLLFLLLLPIALGILGYLIPNEKGPATYTSAAIISLGSYQDQDLNDPKSVITLLTTPPFYEQNLPDLWKEQQADLLTNLKVTAVSTSSVNLSYTGSSQEEAIAVVNNIATTFMKAAEDSFQKRQAIIQDSINTLDNQKVGPDAVVDQQRFLFDQKTALLNMKPAVLVSSASNQGANQTKSLSKKDKAVLGVLLGLTFIFFWIVIPELQRKQ